MAMIEMNVNDNVWVKLTPVGEKMWTAAWRYMNTNGVPKAIRESYTEKDGRVRFQFHELMHIFGEAMWNGNSELPFKDNKLWFEK